MLTEDAIIIEAHDRASRDLQLEEATRLLSEKATDRGILVTRHSFTSFTATFSSCVEYGHIQELDLL
ncbi:hypothetical protein [Paenarthrobacter ureafaciens]|uniref:hypothetical protein n=1 Tax=Paenarthrobacter ureafaciens TaxID=37931 RepID=UPI002DBBDF0F|nr:hypothetical protein [Paenarthrobacter ureafaciens]MEC3853898.1 hypothetical protein [Paenarthrobacter ureafaciens]